MNLLTLKGFRDFLPPEAKKRQYVVGILKSVFEKYGFDPLETPTLEYEETLTGKYGDEGDKLMYKFVDHGQRNVAMRYDQTVPLSRVVAKYQNTLTFPFKRYQIQPVFRADNTQKGRFRELLQCDIDTVGTASLLADAEIVAMVIEAYQSLGFKHITARINDRSVFAGLPTIAITIIDKLKKIGPAEVKKELEEKGIPAKTLDEITTLQPTVMIQTIMDHVKKFGITDDIMTFDSTLARGLDYYTGMILEIEIPEYTVGSVGGGGRYDKLIGMFAGREIPATGFAFGFDRIIEAMEEQNLFPAALAKTKALVTIFSKELMEKSLEISSRLRLKNIPVELYLDETVKMEKQLKYADQKGIPYVIIIGPDEVSKEIVTLRNMKTREQKQISLNSLPDEII